MDRIPAYPLRPADGVLDRVLAVAGRRLFRRRRTEEPEGEPRQAGFDKPAPQKGAKVDHAPP